MWIKVKYIIPYLYTDKHDTTISFAETKLTKFDLKFKHFRFYYYFYDLSLFVSPCALSTSTKLIQQNFSFSC